MANEATGAYEKLFEKYERVIYDKNPLIDVTLQLRFPTFLRFRSSPPSEFQEMFIGDYPHYQAEEQMELSILNPNSPPSVVENKIHHFLSVDKTWRVSIAPDYVSISTKQYERWEDFKNRAMACFTAFFGLYPMKLVTKVGLRYRDVVRPSMANIGQGEWKRLINPVLLGPLGDDGFGQLRFESARWAQRFSGDGVQVVMQGGLRTYEGQRSYFLDFDASIQKETIVSNVNALDTELEQLHEPIGPLFRWAITDELHNSLGPKSAKS